MFHRGRSKKKEKNFVRALRTSIGWIIPSQNREERRDEKKLEQKKEESRKAYAEELKLKVKSTHARTHARPSFPKLSKISTNVSSDFSSD